MATFILKSENDTINFDSLPPGPLKQSFSELLESVTHQLHTLKCDTHHHEPIIVLQGDAHGVRLSGICTCCREFGETVRGILKLPEDVMCPDVGITTERTSYTYYS
jgi:hypothetical protein